ncbi:hypothetical protein Btru_058275 [Bulinus truncatus]|nr:hypothetical protein Btru_058275 [Bulinus truncatus]
MAEGRDVRKVYTHRLKLGCHFVSNNTEDLFLDVCLCQLKNKRVLVSVNSLHCIYLKMLRRVTQFAFILVCVAAHPDMKQVNRDCQQECNESAPPMGDMSCPDGYVCHQSGCSSTCVPEVLKRSPDCGVVVCSTWCEDGRVMDHNGCPTCTCL